MQFGKPRTKFTFGKSDKKIKDVEPITGACSSGLENEEDLLRWVEEPCRQVCQDLMKKNIRSLDSGCNKLFPQAYVVISYDGLDLKNKMIAQKLVREGKAGILKSEDDVLRYSERALKIVVSSELEDSVSIVSQRLRDAFSIFKKQEKIGANFNSKHELLRKYGALPSYDPMNHLNK